MSGEHAVTDCDFRVVKTDRDPFPHVVKSEFLEPELYARIKAKYPQIPKSGREGRTGYDLYRGDAGYDELMADEDWGRLFNALNSQDFVDYIAAQFADVLTQSKIAGKTLRFVDVVETRELLTRPEGFLGPGDKLEEIFVRIDVQQGHPGYQIPMHCDYGRRVASMILFFCDQQDCGMVGGEFNLHKENVGLFNRPMFNQGVLSRGPFRKLPKGGVVKTQPPRDNTVLIFPGMRKSFHSVSPLVKTNKPRDFLYVGVSSRANIW
ncbi:MAG: 2OG-Fe(II) oxygenase [Planctomycetales bacterium]|nr:2OG-Fe(II) oxygenase [Planctomycetales bacterium]